MKTFFSGALTLACLLAFTPFASAQSGGATIVGPDGEPAIISRSGTVSEIGADALIIRSENSPEPIRYRFSKSTTYLDDAGAPVSIETVRSGLPVTVYYVRDGDQLTARRVIVRRQTTSRTSDPAPTVIERNTSTTITKPPVVVEKKVYVDRPVDRPVIVEKKVLVPVEKKVYVDRPVIVEKVPPATPAPVIIEKKTTTTTTTNAGDK